MAIFLLDTDTPCISIHASDQICYHKEEATTRWAEVKSASNRGC